MNPNVIQNVKYSFRIRIKGVTGLDLSPVRPYYENDINNSSISSPSSVPGRQRSMTVSRANMMNKLELIWKRGKKYEGALEDVVLGTERDGVCWKDDINFDSTLSRYAKKYNT